jgi:hypothetical protein
MSNVRSLAFDEGRETTETPMVRMMSESQRLEPRVRPSRTIMKTAVVMIYFPHQLIVLNCCPENYTLSW